MDRFVLTDEGVNCYGFRLLTKGANIKTFLKNPVMLFMHWRGGIMGKWEDIQVSKEDANITAIPSFDMTDPVAAGLASKCEQGMINATSVGADPVEWSDAPELIVSGQTRPTVTKWDLNEASLVDIPGNKGALRLNLGNGLWLTDDTTANAGQLDKFLQTLPNLKTATRMEQILLTLGLAATATQEQAVAAIAKLRTDNATERAELVVSLAEKAGLVTAANKDKFVKLVNAAPALALEFLDFSQVPLAAPTAAPLVVPPAAPAAPGVTLAATLAALGQQNAAAAAVVPPAATGRATWNLRKWETEDPKAVQLMRKNEPEKYQRLYDEFYGNHL